jgi:hypothetical protein
MAYEQRGERGYGGGGDGGGQGGGGGYEREGGGGFGRIRGRRKLFFVDLIHVLRVVALIRKGEERLRW